MGSVLYCCPPATPAESPPTEAVSEEGPEMVLVRQEIGEVLRDFRQQKGRTLRQVASRASVALGYLSEVERGQKEASSEILASVAEALDVPISTIMRDVGDRLAVIEGVDITRVGIDSVT